MFRFVFLVRLLFHTREEINTESFPNTAEIYVFNLHFFKNESKSLTTGKIQKTSNSMCMKKYRENQ